MYEKDRQRIIKWEKTTPHVQLIIAVINELCRFSLKCEGDIMTDAERSDPYASAS